MTAALGALFLVTAAWCTAALLMTRYRHGEIHRSNVATRVRTVGHLAMSVMMIDMVLPMIDLPLPMAMILFVLLIATPVVAVVADRRRGSIDLAACDAAMLGAMIWMLAAQLAAGVSAPSAPAVGGPHTHGGSVAVTPVPIALAAALIAVALFVGGRRAMGGDHRAPAVVMTAGMAVACLAHA